MKQILKFFGTFFVSVLFTFCSFTVKESPVINLLPVREGSAFRYINQQGKVIFIPQFKQATVFRNGLALVQVFGNKPFWGFITEDGKFVIKPLYKEASVFSEGMAWVVTENGAPKAIDEKGDSIFSLISAKTVRIFKDGLASFSICSDTINLKWGFVDKKGNIKIEPQFSAIRDFSEGRCAVANSAGEWGYIDSEGKLVINYQYKNAKDFNNGKAIVLLGKEYGVIDKTGKFVVNPQFSEMLADGNQYIIKQNNKWGWCNQNGDITIQPQFIEAYPFRENELAPVKSGDKFGFINKKGKMVIDPQFETALPFNGKIAWAITGHKGGFIDKHGKYIIQAQYDAISGDVKSFLLNQPSTFESVNTDYFDLDTITNRLKKEISDKTIEGMNFSTPLSAIFAKYKISETDFNKSTSEHQVVKGERISNDATLDFFVLGNPWNKTDNGRLGFTFTLKPNYTHSGFSYRINLRSKALGKEYLVLKSLKTALTDYSKDNKHSNENVLILQSKFQLIVCLKQNGIVIVAVYPITPENLQMIESNYSNGLEADSTIVATDSISAN